jgi:SAM-dependent methyltransferase
MLSRIKKFFKENEAFNSAKYWEGRYSSGGNSGEGSYGRLAEFKATVLNDFVREHNIQSVIEFGCGDGNQLALASYPQYIGLDVSRTVIMKCISKFKSDNTKSFFLYDQDCFADRGNVFLHDVALSLDVLYHLIEDDVYEMYLKNLFSSSSQFVIIYAVNKNNPRPTTHEHYRKFTNDIERLIPGWKLIEEVENKYKPSAPDEPDVSDANFYIYQKNG